MLSFCNARQMTSPEAYIRYSPEVFREDGEGTDDATAAFLRDYMTESFGITWSGSGRCSRVRAIAASIGEIRVRPTGGQTKESDHGVATVDDDGCPTM